MSIAVARFVHGARVSGSDEVEFRVPVGTLTTVQLVDDGGGHL